MEPQKQCGNCSALWDCSVTRWTSPAVAGMILITSGEVDVEKI